MHEPNMNGDSHNQPLHGNATVDQHKATGNNQRDTYVGMNVSRLDGVLFAGESQDASAPSSTKAQTGLASFPSSQHALGHGNDSDSTSEVSNSLVGTQEATSHVTLDRANSKVASAAVYNIGNSTEGFSVHVYENTMEGFSAHVYDNDSHEQSNMDHAVTNKGTSTEGFSVHVNGNPVEAIAEGFSVHVYDNEAPKDPENRPSLGDFGVPCALSNESLKKVSGHSARPSESKDTPQDYTGTLTETNAATVGFSAHVYSDFADKDGPLEVTSMDHEEITEASGVHAATYLVQNLQDGNFGDSVAHGMAPQDTSRDQLGTPLEDGSFMQTYDMQVGCSAHGCDKEARRVHSPGTSSGLSEGNPGDYEAYTLATLEPPRDHLGAQPEANTSLHVNAFVAISL